MYVYFKPFIAEYFNEILCTLHEDDDNAKTYWCYVEKNIFVLELFICCYYQSINIYKYTQ